MDKLTYINELLEGDRRVADVDMTPNASHAEGGVATGSFDVWRPDDPTLDEVSIESSVVYQVPVRVETDEPITYSVQTEWARPFNDLGKFAGTFTTAAIDIAIERPVEPLTPGEAHWADVRLRNRSLEPKRITSVTIETPAGTQELTSGTELVPGDIERIPMEGGGFVPEEGAGETRLQVTVVTADGTTFTQTAQLRHVGAEVSDGSESISAGQESDESSTQSPDNTDGGGDGATENGETEATSAPGSVGPGFGVLTTLAAGGSMLASRLWSDDEE
jgi:hypothetical protein